MIHKQVAVYARVSSTQQADAGTIESQLSALRQRVALDGFALPPSMEFVDDGYSGGSFLRPALERLRDKIYTGMIDRLYVLAPDRLARKYAYQVLLLEEFQQAKVEVVFLNRPSGQSAEDELLLQVQGMMAEYERAKILERTRRGKRYAASQGSVNVLSGAPYGYRYVTKHQGGGQARYELIAEQAQVVRQAFEWVAQERIPIQEVCRRLERNGAMTRAGKTVWNRSSVAEMLKNHAYTGAAPFGRTRLGEARLRLRPLRGRTGLAKRPCSIHPTPTDEWILVPVPAIVSSELFQAVQEQLAENRQRRRQRQNGPRYLLQGLVVCSLCGYGFHGRSFPPPRKGGKGLFYYRCSSGCAPHRTGLAICRNSVVRGEELDQAVWAEVCALLENPSRVQEEYDRRLQKADAKESVNLLNGLKVQGEKVSRSMARLIDSYAEGLIGKEEFEPRIKRLKQRVAELTEQTEQLADEQSQQGELQLLIGQLEEFAKQVEQGLESVDLLTRREIIRAVVRQIEVEAEQIRVVFKVSARPFVLSPGNRTWQHCPGRRKPETME